MSDSVASDWLDQLSALTTHLTLMTGDPAGVSDPLTLEPSSGGYSRAAVSWVKSGRLLRNTNVLAWSGLPPGTLITYVAGFDAAFNGAYTFAAPLTPISYDLSTPGGLVIPINELFVGLDA